MKTPTEKELRELDYYLAEHVMGWKRGRKWANGNGEWIINGPGYEHHHISVYQTPHYTTDPAGAMTVLKACSKKLKAAPVKISFEASMIYESVWKVCALYRSKYESAQAPTLELAICEFAKQLKSK